MPVQTTKKQIYYPDGALVSIKPFGESTYFDVGAINSAVNNTLNYDENQVETANAGKTDKQIRNMTVAGSFTLINLQPEAIEKMGAGIFTRVVTAGTPVTTSDDQEIAIGWADNTLYDLLPSAAAASTSILRATVQPTLTSVTLDPTGTPEVLVEDSEYVVVENSNSASGWSIQFISGNMSTGSPTTFEIVVDYASVTPIASETVYAGTSTVILAAYAMKITHTDDNGKIRQLELFSVDSDSGGFQFNFKGANEDGLEEMPLTYTAKLDTTLTSGQQLLAWTVQDGAQ